jgi:predicted DNA-binding transcriptional regulator AlpA
MTAAAPLLIDAAQAASLCGLSRSTWFSMQSCGAIPAAVLRRGRLVRWSRQEIESWISAGCPSRDTWEIVKGSQR